MTFQDTHWSLVLKAGTSDDAAREALGILCAQYWPPLYSFLRAKGFKKDDAADVLQGFFAHILEKRAIDRADPAAGRFRSYLLTILIRYAGNEYAKSKALKRGGHVAVISFDRDGAEALHSQIMVRSQNPEEIYERQWAMSVLNQAMDRLARDYERAGKRELFETLGPALVTGESTSQYAEIAERLNMKEGTVRVAMHRLRSRFRSTLLQVVADTVDSPEDVESEIRELLEILSRPTTIL